MQRDKFCGTVSLHDESGESESQRHVPSDSKDTSTDCEVVQYKCSARIRPSSQNMQVQWNLYKALKSVKLDRMELSFFFKGSLLREEVEIEREQVGQPSLHTWVPDGSVSQGVIVKSYSCRCTELEGSVFETGAVSNTRKTLMALSTKAKYTTR